MSIFTCTGGLINRNVRPTSLLLTACFLLECGDIEPHPGPHLLQYSSQQLRTLYTKRTKIRPAVWNTLSELHLLIPFRGCRSGIKQKLKAERKDTKIAKDRGPIPVMITTRSGKLHQPIANINRNNLIPIPLVKSMPTLALMNCQSVRNKTTVVMDHIIEHKVDIAVLT